MNPVVDIQNASEEPVPDDDSISRWCAAALAGAAHEQPAEIAVRIVDEPEMVRVNGQFRGRHRATNVLSFPADLPPELGEPLLGDLLVCAPVVHREAAEQHKAPEDHWAHMLIHGTLHLLGYDHVDSAEAEVMEALETRILATLGIDCPYTSRTTAQALS